MLKSRSREYRLGLSFQIEQEMQDEKEIKGGTANVELLYSRNVEGMRD